MVRLELGLDWSCELALSWDWSREWTGVRDGLESWLGLESDFFFNPRCVRTTCIQVLHATVEDSSPRPRLESYFGLHRSGLKQG